MPSATGLGKKVGGWVFGKWGATPSPTTSIPAAPRPGSSSSGQSSQTQDSLKKDEGSVKRSKEVPIRLRAPGVNQSGPIWGFFDVPPTPTQVVVTDLDADALGEALADS